MAIARRGKVALVCAGGGITGAVYEIGCLRAIHDLIDRSLLDLDVYVGISGGAFVASLLAAGISPLEMYEELVSPSTHPLGVSGAPLFRFGARQYVHRGLRAPQVLRDALLNGFEGEGHGPADAVLTLLELLPAGLLENSGIQEYLAAVFKSRGVNDRFAALGRELYVVAVDIDNGEAVPFGAPGHSQVPVSRAVQASAALPGFYRPVRIGGRDYIDGGVQKTAHISLAIQRGADLVICINPIVPILNDTTGGPLRGHLSQKGIGYVLDQAFRIMLHSRMRYGLERYRREFPDVDILLIEPRRDDMRMFGYNIMRYAARRVVARHGYRSALRTFQEDRGRLRRMLLRHGIEMHDPRRLPATPEPRRYRSALSRQLDVSLERLDSTIDSLGPAAKGDNPTKRTQ